MNDSPPYEVRPFRFGQRWKDAVVTVLFLGMGATALAMIMVWDLSWWYMLLPMVTGAALEFFFWFRVPCPQCQALTKHRSEPKGDGTNWRKRFYDCARCEITWDPKIEFESGS
jgi:hypothetical protein